MAFSLSRPNYLFAFLQLVFLVFTASLLPMTQDEAYYYAWTSSLSWGYFDHPPMIAWFIHLGKILGWFLPLEAQIRLFPSLCSVGLGLLAAGHGNAISSKGYGLLVQSSLSLSFAGLLMGILATPDIPVAFFWGLALHFSFKAILADKPHNWLFAGLFTGLGLLGKYTVVLLGPVFLVSLLFKKKKQLFTPWPYLGGVVCLLIFSPNLIWNHNHDWQTFKFQIGHGVGAQKDQLKHDVLPTAQPRRLSAARSAYEVIPYFQSNKEIEVFEEIKKPKPEKGFFEKAQRNVGDFIGAQLGFWGFLSLSLLSLFFWNFFTKSKVWGSIQKDRSRRRDPMHLAAISTLTPLTIFGIWSVFSKVEGNWSSMYMITGCFFVAAAHLHHKKVFYLLSAGNILTFLLIVVFAASPTTLIDAGILPKKGLHKNRLLVETHGYEKLAESLLKSYEGNPIFADSYQIVSMLRFYRDRLLHADTPSTSISIDQWPGVTRPSHFILDRSIREYSFSVLRDFKLVTTDSIPPFIEGFKATSAQRVNDCLSSVVIRTTSLPGTYLKECTDLIHRWNIYTYKKSD